MRRQKPPHLSQRLHDITRNIRHIIDQATTTSSGPVADAPGFSTEDSFRIMLYADNGAANQKWRLQYDDAGYFKSVNVHGGKLMGVTSGSTTYGA